MTFESLKIFCDVVRQRSFSRGAAVNNVSQSAASQAINQLEKRLGIQLIDRSKRPLSLTAAGKTYYDGCRELVERYFKVEAQTQALHNGGLNHLVVASIFSVGLYNMNQYVKRFTDAFPNGTVRLDYLHPTKVYERVLKEEADIGILSFPRVRREIHTSLWREEPMVLVCSPTHPFVQAESLTIDQLNGRDFVAFDSDLAIRRHVDRYLRRNNVQPNIMMEFDNIEAIKRAIEIDVGISLLPLPTVQAEITSGALTLVPVKGCDLTRPLSIIFRRGRPQTPAMLGFLEILRADGGSAWKDNEDMVLSPAGAAGDAENEMATNPEESAAEQR